MGDHDFTKTVKCNKSYIDLEHISPYVRYVNNYAPTWSYTEPLRIIYDYEFMYVMNGYADIFYNGKHYHIEKSDIFYFRPGIPNQMEIHADAGFHTHCIHFDWLPPKPEHDFSAEDIYIHTGTSPDYDNKINMLLQRPDYEPEAFQLPPHCKSCPPVFEELFEACYYTYLQQSATSRLQLKSIFLRIISELYLMTSPSYQEALPLIHPKVKKTIDLIQRQYTQPVTVRELADKCELSEKYLGTIFKDALGKSIHEFLMETRIAAARELLKGTSLSIAEIAEQTGFHNIYYFSRCFKEMEHMTPSSYRKL